MRNITSTEYGHTISRRRWIDEYRRQSGDILSRSTLAFRQSRAVRSGLRLAERPSVQSAMYGKLRLRIDAARTLYRRGIMYVLIYIAAVAVANLMVAHFGPAATPIIAFLLIGLDLAIRDRLHLDWRGRALWSRMFALIAAAGVVSYALNPAAKEIAVASLVAFGSAAVASAIVFQLARRFPILARANGANVAGAAVDSIIFPLIAFGAVFPAIAALQFVAKVAGGALWSWVVFRNTRSAQAGIASNVVDR
ncbi:VUT family protein [Burkholderia cepacia]|uniref:VUT family protein n=1 Tax=Burkholderia cepacia TaxID=292 RepID=UPI001F0ED095|nr:VUT family protein [Burkholderia cepacia]